MKKCPVTNECHLTWLWRRLPRLAWITVSQITWTSPAYKDTQVYAHVSHVHPHIQTCIYTSILRADVCAWDTYTCQACTHQGTSDAIANLNHDRYKDFDSQPGKQVRTYIYAFVCLCMHEWICVRMCVAGSCMMWVHGSARRAALHILKCMHTGH
jgi:hypothetical protein